jgi:hypothetical protein
MIIGLGLNTFSSSMTLPINVSPLVVKSRWPLSGWEDLAWVAKSLKSIRFAEEMGGFEMKNEGDIFVDGIISDDDTY